MVLSLLVLIEILLAILGGSATFLKRKYTLLDNFLE